MSKKISINIEALINKLSINVAKPKDIQATKSIVTEALIKALKEGVPEIEKISITEQWEYKKFREKDVKVAGLEGWEGYCVIRSPNSSDPITYYCKRRMSE